MTWHLRLTNVEGSMWTLYIGQADVQIAHCLPFAERHEIYCCQPCASCCATCQFLAVTVLLHLWLEDAKHDHISFADHPGRARRIQAKALHPLLGPSPGQPIIWQIWLAECCKCAGRVVQMVIALYIVGIES